MSETHAALGEVATLQAGFGFPPNLQGRTTGDYPFAKVGDISRCGRSDSSVLSTADHYVDKADLKILRAKLVPVGSILFAKIGEAIRQNHRVVAGCPMLIDNNAMAAIPGGKIEGRFLYYYLKTVDFYALAPATTVPALRKSDLERLLIPLPPLPEQRRIAAILDQAETLRTQRRAALAQLDSLTQSLFLDMFGDPVTNPKGWPKQPVGYLGKVHTGKTPPSQNAEYFEGHIPFVTPGDLDSELESTSRSLSKSGAAFCTVVRAGSALVGCIGNIGKIGKAREPSTFNQQINAIEWSNAIDDNFGIAALRHAKPQMIALSSSTTLPILNKSNFSKVEIVTPPLPLQQTFATRVQAIEALKTQHRAALAAQDALFASLQQRAFAGTL